MPSLTIMGMCSTDRKSETELLVRTEAEKLSFLHPQTSVVEIQSESGKFFHSMNKFCIERLHLAFQTDFVLTVQFDGRILNPKAWMNDFFNYDYIGAPWGDKVVGNGGFSLRSRKLCEFVAKHYAEEYNKNYFKWVCKNPLGNEDLFICRICKSELERNGFKFAPYGVAIKFSVEHGEYVGQLGAHHSIVFQGRLYNLKQMSEVDFKYLFQKTSV